MPDNHEADIEQLLFDNPKKALDIVREQTKQEMRDEYRQAQGQTSFWNDFYKQNPELRPHHVVVNSLLQARYQDLADLTVDKAMGHLAKHTHDYLRASKRHEKEMAERAVYSGGPGDEDGSQSGKPFDYTEMIARDSQSLGGLLRNRKEARREAATRNLDRYAREAKQR